MHGTKNCADSEKSRTKQRLRSKFQKLIFKIKVFRIKSVSGEDHRQVGYSVSIEVDLGFNFTS